ncbi:hypothetical protein IRJ74_004219 [Escherichia coli]|nr:hypothetical protein [Escherichia coli]EGL7849431.1 hypothetical protein [Escherichia coli]
MFSASITLLNGSPFHSPVTRKCIYHLHKTKLAVASSDKRNPRECEDCYGTAMNPATTGAAVSYGLLTRAYESEPFRNAMLRMANTPRGSTAFEKAMQQAQKAINALTQGAKSDALSE